ncbi:MAG TPA: dynamin family protein [Thermomicrobiaceae bacterium]|nr:dynamin family protein [Thermomicrobiaceae bacterium]
MSQQAALPPDQILSQRQEELRERAAHIVEQLVLALKEVPAGDEDIALLIDAAERLRSFFLLVIVGEFNSGKSALINTLLGAEVMPEGVTPTTSAIHLLRYGAAPAERVLANGVIEHSYPAPLLQDVTLVDTPGTNAIVREHEVLSQNFVPRADLVLFVTSADRPFTESERRFLEEIRDWGKKIVLVVNKIDLLQTEAEREQVERFVRDNALRLLGLQPEIFALSGRLARQAELSQEPAERERLRAASHFAPFERFLIESLDQEARIRLKILNPLGIAERLATRYHALVGERLGVLARDVQTIEQIERRLESYRAEMRADFTGYLSRVETIVHRMNDRADEFFEETIRIGRVVDLMNRERIRADFEEQVVSDTERQIDQAVQEMIDWMVGRDLQIWQAVHEYIERRELDRHTGEVVGEAAGSFHYDRQAVLQAVGRRADEVLQRYDPEREGSAIADSIRDAVAHTALVEVGAVGLGAVVVALATSVAFDVTGILAAIMVGGLGLLILPYRKRKARELLRRRSAELLQRLTETLSDQFEREIERSVARVRDTVGPYGAFVRGEREKLERASTALDRVEAEVRDTRRVLGD